MTIGTTKLRELLALVNTNAGEPQTLTASEYAVSKYERVPWPYGGVGVDRHGDPTAAFIHLEDAQLYAAVANALPSLLAHIDALEARVEEAESKTSGVLEVKLIDQNGIEVGHENKTYDDMLKDEVYRDEHDTIWTRPTAWAFWSACRARDAHQRQRDELLARIHRDGGHYTEKHGVEKSCADADQIVASLFAQRDEAIAALKVAREALAPFERLPLPLVPISESAQQLVRHKDIIAAHIALAQIDAVKVDAEGRG